MSTERVERSYRLEPLDSSGMFLGLACILISLVLVNEIDVRQIGRKLVRRRRLA